VLAYAGPVTSNTIDIDRDGAVPLSTPFTFVIAPGEVMADANLNLTGIFFLAGNLQVDWSLDNIFVGSTTVGGFFGGFDFDLPSTNAALMAELNDGLAFLTGAPVAGGALVFGGTATLTGNSVAPVPEPSTLLLFVLGVVVAGRMARKRSPPAE
jgi:hypothetical protein